MDQKRKRFGIAVPGSVSKLTGTTSTTSTTSTTIKTIMGGFEAFENPDKVCCIGVFLIPYSKKYMYVFQGFPD